MDRSTGESKTRVWFCICWCW